LEEKKGEHEKKPILYSRKGNTRPSQTPQTEAKARGKPGCKGFREEKTLKESRVLRVWKGDPRGAQSMCTDQPNKKQKRGHDHREGKKKK